MAGLAAVPHNHSDDLDQSVLSERTNSAAMFKGIGCDGLRGNTMPGLITMDDLSNEEILHLDDAQRLLPVAEGKTYLPLLQGKILGNLFLNRARTLMSFETAMKRLGGDANLGDVKTSSVVKGETLFDTIQMVDGYDIIAMHTPRQGAAQYAQDAAKVPILNGGDGAGTTPQTMLHHSASPRPTGGLKVILVGDLRYGRTVHSLSHALTAGCELILASPSLLKMPPRSLPTSTPRSDGHRNRRSAWLD